MIDIKAKIGIDKQALAVMQRYAQKKRLKAELLERNELALQRGEISQAKYENIKKRLTGGRDG